MSIWLRRDTRVSIHLESRQDKVGRELTYRLLVLSLVDKLPTRRFSAVASFKLVEIHAAI